jgi:hypothetical protein
MLCTDGTMQRRSKVRGRSKGRAFACGIGVVAALTLLSACSTYDSLFGSRPSTAASPPPAPSNAPSFTQRFSNFVIGDSSTTAQGDNTGGPNDLDCPSVEIRQGASTYALSATDNGSAALSLRYQANFVRFARECALRGPNVTLKVGIEGRLILGPAGTAGDAKLPVRLAVVKEGLSPQTVWTKFYLVPVQVPPGQTNVAFTQVEEDMTFPMPPGNQFDQYVIYVGFDPQSMTPEPKKKPVKPARKPRPRPAPAQ